MIESKERRMLGLLLGVWGVLYLWGLGAPDFDYSIEAMRALMGRAMIERHDWLVPWYHGHLYLAKPPLMYWLIALSSLPVGQVTEWSARIPSAFSTLLLALVVVAWARRRGWTRSAWYAGLLLLVLPLFLEKGGRAEIEVSLALWVGCSLMCLHEGMEPGVKRGLLWIAAAYLFLGLALLSKGPPALMFYAGTLIPYLFYCGIRSARPVAHALGLLLLAAGVGAWLVPLISTLGWDVVWETFKREALGRVSHASDLNKAPFYFYLVSLLGGAFPAVLFLPWFRMPPRASAPRRAAVFLLFWVGSALVLFSLVQGKESRYLLPAYPAVAILGALGLERCLEKLARGTKDDPGRRPLLITGVVLAVLGPVVYLVQTDRFPAASPWGVVWGGACLLLGITLFTASRKRRMRLAWALLLCFIVVIKGFHLTVLVPERNSRRSGRVVCRQIHALVPEKTPIWLIGVDKPQIDFYLRRPVRYEPSLSVFAKRARPGGDCYLLGRGEEPAKADLSHVERRFSVEETGVVKRGSQSYYLLHLRGP